MIDQSSQPQDRLLFVTRIPNLVLVKRSMSPIEKTARMMACGWFDVIGTPGGGGLVSISSPFLGSSSSMPYQRNIPRTISKSSAVRGGWPTIADGGPGILP